MLCPGQGGGAGSTPEASWSSQVCLASAFIPLRYNGRIPAQKSGASGLDSRPVAFSCVPLDKSLDFSEPNVDDNSKLRAWLSR